jgi:hypothetical protein
VWGFFDHGAQELLALLAEAELGPLASLAEPVTADVVAQQY